MLLSKVGSYGGTVSVSYTGAGDIVSGAFGYWGVWAYNAASIGNNVIELREDGGNTLSNFATTASGLVDTAAISSFKGANNLFVRTLYDQTGNGRHFQQTTNANQPPFFLNSVGSSPAIVTDGSTNYGLDLTIGASLNSPWTVTAAAECDANAVWQFVFCSDTAGTNDIDLSFGFSGTSPANLIDGSVATSSIDDHNMHAITGFSDATQNPNGLLIRVDSTENSATSSGVNFTSGDNLHLCRFPTGSRLLNGKIGEFGMWSGAFNGTQRANMNTNIKTTRWGF